MYLEVCVLHHQHNGIAPGEHVDAETSQWQPLAMVLPTNLQFCWEVLVAVGQAAAAVAVDITASSQLQASHGAIETTQRLHGACSACVAA